MPKMQKHLIRSSFLETVYGVRSLWVSPLALKVHSSYQVTRTMLSDTTPLNVEMLATLKNDPAAQSQVTLSDR
jgi:hypothetical protein